MDGVHPSCYVVSGNKGFPGQVLKNVKITGLKGTIYTENYGCTTIGNTGYFGCRNYECVAFSSDFGFCWCPENVNCICVGAAASGGFYQCEKNKECIAYGNAFGFIGPSLNADCQAAYCGVGFGEGCNNIYCKSFACVENVTEADPGEAVVLDFEFTNILKDGIVDFGVNSEVATQTDIDGLTRIGGSSVDIGPWELPNVEYDYENYKNNSPSLKITGLGEVKLEFAIKKDNSVAKSVWVKSDPSDNPPSMIVRTIDEDIKIVANNTDGEWERLLFCFIPGRTEVAELILRANDPEGVVYFSDVV